jgi:flagellar P-ring protein FlgI
MTPLAYEQLDELWADRCFAGAVSRKNRSAEEILEIPMLNLVRFPVCRSFLLSVAALLTLGTAGPVSAADVSAQGTQSEVIMGVGLVIGLPGTGDSEVDKGLVDSSIVGVLKRAGLDMWHGQIEPGRVAKVVVTAQLPADPSDGARLVTSVSAVGNAASLAGGTLLATPLRDQDGNLYAIGQGSIGPDGQLVKDPAVERHLQQLASK